MKLIELTAIKDKVDSMCVTSASASSAFASQPRIVHVSIHKRQLKVIPVSECVETKNSNDRAMFDKASIETIIADLGTEVIIEDCRRLEKVIPGKSRSVLVTFSNIWNARKLRSKAIEQQVYRHIGVLIVPELSYEDRQVEKNFSKNDLNWLIRRLKNPGLEFETRTFTLMASLLPPIDYSSHYKVLTVVL